MTMQCPGTTRPEQPSCKWSSVQMVTFYHEVTKPAQQTAHSPLSPRSLFFFTTRRQGDGHFSPSPSQRTHSIGSLVLATRKDPLLRTIVGVAHPTKKLVPTRRGCAALLLGQVGRTGVTRTGPVSVAKPHDLSWCSVSHGAHDVDMRNSNTPEHDDYRREYCPSQRNRFARATPPSKQKPSRLSWSQHMRPTIRARAQPPNAGHSTWIALKSAVMAVTRLAKEQHVLSVEVRARHQLVRVEHRCLVHVLRQAASH